MAISPKTDLLSLSEGTRYLTSRPLATTGIAALGMVLAAMAPLLQLRAGLPDDPMVDTALTFACLLPLELYFIPRFLIAADAMAGSEPNPLNAPEEWPRRFEERWLRSFWAKVLLALGAGIGLSLFILPGLLVLLAFGWVPLRVLLRGESIVQAAKGSMHMMSRTWQRVIMATSAMAAAYLSMIVILAFLEGLLVQDPSARQRLVHPAVWAGNFLGSMLSLWLSACLLALFRRVETVPPLEETGPKID